MVEAVKLFNKVNGTNYDGIVAPTETVAFYPNQIKNINNLCKLNPTIVNNPAIYGLLAEKQFFWYWFLQFGRFEQNFNMIAT